MEKKETHLSELVDYLKDRGYGHTQKEVAKSLGYNESSFSQIINGVVKISPKFIKRITALIPDINSDWLQTGEGEIIKEHELVLETEVREEESIYRLSNSDKEENEVDHLLKALTAQNLKNKSLRKNLEKSEEENQQLKNENEQLKRKIEILKNNQIKEK